MSPLWLRLALAALASSLLACGGDTGAGSAGDRIKFVNNWLAAPDNSELRVIIEACSQDFLLEPGESRIVDCVVDSDLSTLLVRIEGRITGLSYVGDQPDIWEGQVAGGQTVTVTGQVNQISVEVED